MATEDDGRELYLFGCRSSDAVTAGADVVGGKPANLVRMAAAGLPVPPGCVLPTAVCRAFFQAGGRLPQGTADLLHRGIREMERATGQTFGGDRRPLLVSVRSGPPVSMPGMLDTVLNVGLCDRTLPALVRMTGNPRHAWDSYRRLVPGYAGVVHGRSTSSFERALVEALHREGVPVAAELDVAALKGLTREFLDLYESEVDEPFPQDPETQLVATVEAVLRSWQSPRAVKYRQLQGLDDLVGTAVAVQAMVFGNMGSTSGSGVGFTRNPATGENDLYVDFLWNAQGEDVVSGRCPVQGSATLQQVAPELLNQLRQIARQLESLFQDAQDFEFTVQEGRLYLLQTRAAKRTPWAALRIACDLAAERRIDEGAALRQLRGYDLASIRMVRVSATDGSRLVGSGVAASPGVAVGPAAFDPAAAARMAAAGRPPILIRQDMATDDITGIAAAAGILTARGGRTSHAAVVARQLDKVCIVGCGGLAINGDGKSGRIGDATIGEGATVSLDGHTGRVYLGAVKVVVDEPREYLQKVEGWKSRVGESGKAVG